MTPIGIYKNVNTIDYECCLFPNGKGSWHLQWVRKDVVAKKWKPTR